MDDKRLKRMMVELYNTSQPAECCFLCNRPRLASDIIRRYAELICKSCLNYVNKDRIECFLINVKKNFLKTERLIPSAHKFESKSTETHSRDTGVLFKRNIKQNPRSGYSNQVGQQTRQDILTSGFVPHQIRTITVPQFSVESSTVKHTAYKSFILTKSKRNLDISARSIYRSRLSTECKPSTSDSNLTPPSNNSYNSKSPNESQNEISVVAKYSLPTANVDSSQNSNTRHDLQTLSVNQNRDYYHLPCYHCRKRMFLFIQCSSVNFHVFCLECVKRCLSLYGIYCPSGRKCMSKDPDVPWTIPDKFFYLLRDDSNLLDKVLLELYNNLVRKYSSPYAFPLREIPYSILEEESNVPFHSGATSSNGTPSKRFYI